MTEQLDRLKFALADRYAIDRELGSGGMATVYLAEDLKHRRQVAIKVLRPELAASLGVDRFVREIEIAANLTHPHILPLHDSGDADGFLYYVMPYIEGESLRERLDREEKIPIAEIVRLTDEVAAALSYAHEQGIVHRDVKPENIMLSGGRAVVADFGIARAVSVAGGGRLTGTGFAVGTPAYMSPEQAFGDANVDGRTDVYSLGCVVYEMVSGHAPFEADTPQALLAKHAADTAPSLRTSDPSIPLFLERAVGRALAKSPADRFQTASAFAEALTTELVVARVGGSRWRRVAAFAAVIVLLLVVGAWWLASILGGPAYERLAVLPPANMMNDAEQEYFVAGMHNALISELQKAGVPVIARTSVLQYENTQKPIREIASELRVDALVEASVFRSGDSVEMEVRLVDCATEQYVTDPIVRRSDVRSVVAMYRDLTGALADEIQLALTPEAETRLASAREVDPQAYDAYLKGQFYVGQITPPDLEAALQYFEQALEYDPEYALAYAGIALVWVARSQFGYMRPRDARPPMTAAMERAVELDSTLVEVQSALAAVRTWHLWDWAGAEVAFERAVEINPNYPDVRVFYSHFLLSMQRPDEAMRHSQLAVELDPFNPITQSFHGMVLYMVGRYDEAIAQFNTLLRTIPDHPLALSGLQQVYDAKGMYEESLEAASALYTVTEDTQIVEALALGQAEGGYRGAMSRAAATWAALSSQAYVPPWEIAQLYAFAGNDSEALSWLERGFEERDPNMPYLSASPQYSRLRDDPRFQDLRRRMGLPE